MLASIALGTLLNPLNSSMIAVALINLHIYFGISVATVTWLVSGFYLAAAVGQPLMGRFANLFGPRRIFCSGMLLVCVASALAPWVHAFGWLVALRVLQAFGTSAAHPSGQALMRTFAQMSAGKAKQRSNHLLRHWVCSQLQGTLARHSAQPLVVF